MRGESCNPIQDVKDSEVFLEDGVHFRAIEDRFGLLLVSQFLQRKWGTEDILGQAFPPPLVLASDFDLIVNAETGIFPGEELFDQFLADLSLAEQQLENLVAKKAFLLLYVYFRQTVKPAIRHKAAVGDQTV